MIHMHNTINPLIIRMMACLAGLFFLFMGCGKKTEPPKPKVFSQKITIDRTIPQDRKTLSDQTTMATATVLPRKEADLPPEPAKPVSKAAEPVPESAKLLSMAVKPLTGDSEPVDNGTDDKSSVSRAAAPETTPTPGIAYAYNPKDKIDPFMPWYEGERITSKISVSKRLPLSPLEKVDLSQLKLVGIILSASGNRALVEEATGKGFVIGKGTYIGLNRGKVARILSDRVIIEEAIQYGKSEASIRTRELKLQKPPGDN